MHKSIEGLNQVPELLLIDGNRFKPYKDVPYECIIKGDGKYLSIAAASIVAKVTRDRLMENYHEYYPQFDFFRHKGYPTRAHKEAIRKFGYCPIHRRTFKGVKEYLWIALKYPSIGQGRGEIPRFAGTFDQYLVILMQFKLFVKL